MSRYIIKKQVDERGLLKSLEIGKIVKSMVGDKASCLDGFAMAFVQVCWEVLKDNIKRFFHEFHERGSSGKGLNATFIASYQKKEWWR